MYIYKSSEFLEKVSEEHLDSRISRLCKSLERVGEVINEQIPRFPARYGTRYLKHEERDLRIVAELLDVDGTQVLYLHTIFAHDRHYEQFLGEISAGRYSYSPDIEQVRLWLRENRVEALTTSTARQIIDLPAIYHGWLKRPTWDFENWVVYEGSEWVSEFHKSEFSDRWETMHAILDSILCQMQAGNITTISEFKPFTATDGTYYRIWDSTRGIILARKGDRGILFSQHLIRVRNDDEDQTANDFHRQVVFLVSPVIDESDDNLNKLVSENYPFYEEEDTFHSGFNEIARCSNRVYPGYILADKDLWRDIERDEGVNLALSAEEERILYSLSSEGPRDYRLPIFINGRAGSGKSTILFYVFTDYCTRFFKYRNENELEEMGLRGRPVFLTYSSELLKVAADRVSKMVFTRLAITNTTEQKRIKEQLGNMLRPFREFLREQLPDDSGYEIFFDDARRISFHQFKRIYSENHNPAVRKYSADICWYVIRTFIKGYQLDCYLDPEMYNNSEIIAERDRTVSNKDFRVIYENVWKWYKDYLEKEGYWDDQDLIRAVLEAEQNIEAEYTAIFCDEAQDFTRLELQLILKTSIYQNYRLSNYDEQASLPFAFAGDPLQTLNPSGFRWAKVQAMFHNEIIQGIDPLGRLGIKIKPLDDLLINYRSTKPIVEITNALILVRNRLFDQSTKPQNYWGLGNMGFAPQKYLLSQINIEDLRKNIRDTILLIPCDEGGEKEFFLGDNELCLLFPDDARDERCPKNVISAIGAKGLEFQRVILYKFGDVCPDKAWSVIENSETRSSVDVEYFFNKLYVAGTRATKFLFALESDDGDTKLWMNLTADKLCEYALAIKGQQWKIRPESDQDPQHEYTARPIGLGTPEGVREMQEERPEEIAVEFMNRGITSENPEFLWRARSYYRDLDDTRRATFCEAYAMKFEKRYKEAGFRFVDIEEVQLANDCFWEGMHWQELMEIQGQNRADRMQLAKFMLSDLDTAPILEFAEYLSTIINRKTLPYGHNNQWREVYREFNSRVSQLPANSVNREDWVSLGSLIRDLEDYGYSDIQAVAGLCNMNAGNTKAAIKIWEDNGQVSHQLYYLAKATVSKYPQNLEWLSRAGQTDQIITLWENNGGNTQTLPLTLARYVFPVLNEKQRFWDAGFLAMRSDETNSQTVIAMLKSIRVYTTANLKEHQAISKLIQYLSKNQEWDFLISQIQKITALPTITKENRIEIYKAFIHQLALPETEANMFEISLVRKIEDSIFNQLARQEDWENEIKPDGDLLTAVESMGFDVTLRFFGKFVEIQGRDLLRNSARKHWLANFEKKVEYYKAKGEVIQQIRQLREYEERKKRWNNKLEIPVGSQKVTQRTEVIHKHDATFRDFPVTIKPYLDNGTYFFTIDASDYAVYPEKKIVTISDPNLNRVRFDLEKKTISSGELQLLTTTGDGRLQFSIDEWSLKGEIRDNDFQTILSIELKGKWKPIQIILT